MPISHSFSKIFCIKSCETIAECMQIFNCPSVKCSPLPFDHVGNRYALGRNRESRLRLANCYFWPRNAISRELTSLIIKKKNITNIQKMPVFSNSILQACKTSHLLNISCIHYFRTWFTHSINNCGNIRCDIMRNVYGHVVITVDQSHAFRIFHSAFYFGHSAFHILLTPVSTLFKARRLES